MSAEPKLPSGAAVLRRTDQAYANVKRMIIELAMPPGSHFTESELAATWAVSKTPIREALVMLQHDGLVEALPRAGYRVAPVRLSTTRDLCAFRTLVEGEAAYRCAQKGLQAEELDELDRLVDLEYELTDWESVDHYIRSSRIFDGKLGEFSSSPRLARAVSEILDELERVVRLAMQVLQWNPASTEQRRKIVDAIRARDSVEAREATQFRTRAAEQLIIESLLTSSSLGDTNIVIPDLSTRL